MGSIISSHNKQILQPNYDNFAFNCRIKPEFSLQNKCFTPNIVYKATIKNSFNDDQKRYLGDSETLFKERSGNQPEIINIKSMKNILSF